MPVVLRHNEQLELNLALYQGAVSFAELEAVAGFLAKNPSFLKSDCLSLVAPGADFAGVDLDALDKLFGRYKVLYAPMSFQIVRRSAWICQSPSAQRHVEYWLGDRDTRDAMSSTLRQFDTFAEAGDWLVLNQTETATLESGAGFGDIARFEDAPSQSRPASR